MQPPLLGEWVKGPFANAVISGFITENLGDNVAIRVKTIEEVIGELPRYLKVGARFVIPTSVIYNFFRILNKEQQRSIISLATRLEDYEWAKELTEQFYNQFSNEETSPQENVYTYSTLFKKNMIFTEEEKWQLYYYYHESLNGLPVKSVNSPEEITTETLDNVISSIVLNYDCPVAINFLKKLIKKYVNVPST